MNTSQGVKVPASLVELQNCNRFFLSAVHLRMITDIPSLPAALISMIAAGF